MRVIKRRNHEETDGNELCERNGDATGDHGGGSTRQILWTTRINMMKRGCCNLPEISPMEYPFPAIPSSPKEIEIAWACDYEQDEKSRPGRKPSRL